MSSRTRARGVKTAASVHTIQIPRQRWRRGAQPVMVVVPEQPSLTREALGFLGSALWKRRRSLAPTGIAVLAFTGTALLHAVAWWSGLLLAPLAAGPGLWLGIVQRRHPARSTAFAWRVALAVLATFALVWAALAAGFGPLAGSLELVWLLTWITAQTAWLIVRRKH
ncbi:hypothetical protein [Streptomyces sparsogenes]|uniref:Uncharacterized protein n=1 Tax=Streptomyces sparsogenes DSM 40356 TaxID=1331668 RepID=A0A1R1SI03_9ACTN|nr:hypothetical protein [Streptomyces sparsogenes]OMI37887.1 hypothetical protein SPAR_18938 [Streptomyces sparsogenes DSM 40356]